MCHLDYFLFPSIMVEASYLPSYLEGTLRGDRGGWRCGSMAGHVPAAHKSPGFDPQKLRDYSPKACGCMGSLKVVQKGSLSTSMWVYRGSLSKSMWVHGED